MSLEAALATAILALAPALAVYLRALARRINAKIDAHQQQTERRIRRLTEATGITTDVDGEPILTPPFGVPIQLPIDESEKHRR